MESLSKHSAVTQRNLRYLVACLLAGFFASSVLACASDDDDTDDKEASTAENKTDEEKDSKADDSDKAASSDKDSAKDSEKDTEKATVEEFHPMASAEQEAASKQQMRYDGEWEGKTSQDKPVSFKILSRFLGHLEITYALEGDGCKAEDKAIKISVMNGVRSNAFSAMSTNDSEKMMTMGTFTADSESNGTFTIEAVGDVPEGCNKMLSGTWTATK